MKIFILFIFSFFVFTPAAWANINPNTASASELTGFKGVGKATAQKIITYREANGPFSSCDDLINVKGIGPKKLESIKLKCVIGKAKGGKKLLKKTTKPRKINTKPPAEGPQGKFINPNTATLSQLIQFKGVGKKTAEKILSHRETNGLFASCDDLIKVTGIGTKTLQNIKLNCRVPKGKK